MEERNARLLLENGANVNSVNRRGYTPLLYVCYVIHLDHDFKFLKLLLEYGADIKSRYPDIRHAFVPTRTPLLFALETLYREHAKDIPILIRIFIDAGIDINYQVPETGENVLHTVCEYNDLDSAKLLIHSGCDYKLVNKQGKTPLEKMQVGPQKDIAEFIKSVNLR